MHSTETAYSEFHETLRRYIARRLGNPEEVEDVLQDVFLRVAQNGAALRDARKPLAWLYQVTRTALIDHYRRQGKHKANETGIRIDDIPDLPPEPHDGDFDTCLTPLVERLPEKYRDAVRFVDIEGGRQTDLAKASGVSGPTVRSHVQRGRRMLKTAILDCCTVERDVLSKVTALSPKGPGNNCC